MKKLEKLKQQVKNLITNSNLQEFKEMSISWYGNNSIADALIENMNNCFDVLSLEGFVKDFKDRIEQRQKKEKQPILYIDKDAFISWYFDKDVTESTINILCSVGTVNLNRILEEVGYLPICLIDNPKILEGTEGMSMDDITAGVWNELEGTGSRYQIKFTPRGGAKWKDISF